MSQPLVEVVCAHARRSWPDRKVEAQRWEQGGVVENLPDLSVVRVAPAREDGAWIYLTAGAADAPLEDGYGIELMLLSPRRDDHAVRLLTMVANLHADPRYPLSLGQVLEIGHPWLPGATCDHLLVCLPDAFGPELEWCSDAQRTIRFVWLIPVTAAEAELARSRGWIALQEKLGAAQADVTALERSSAC